MTLEITEAWLDQLGEMHVRISGHVFLAGEKYTILEVGWALYFAEERVSDAWLKEHGETRPAQEDWNELASGQGGLVTSHPVLVALAASAKQVHLENGNVPTEPSLSEADRADFEVFLQNMLGMLPVLGIYAFEQDVPSSLIPDDAVLFCQGRGVSAKGVETSRGFKVFANSEAVAQEVASLREHFLAVSEHRLELIRSGVLTPHGDRLKFSQDYTFTSPSLASAIVLGRSSNGRVDWKDSAGRTLRQIQEAQATER